MNYLQFLLFLIFSFSVSLVGVRLRLLLGTEDRLGAVKSVFTGEALLLGSIVIVGELLLLSLAGLYRAPYLWVVVLLNYAFLADQDVRRKISDLAPRKEFKNIPNLIFSALVIIFSFRNCYFLVDIDSHSVYLNIQKLWLQRGTSIFGDAGTNVLFFIPHFDAVPYSLGLSLFGHETLFCQLINLFWRLIVLLLVFGYASYRFNGYYGLAAVMFVLFDQFHFFYSGANASVIINGALIAFLFAATYNFWEARTQRNSCRFLLALIFLTQLIANKYQMAVVFLLFLGIGFAIQIKPFEMIKDILCNKTRMISLGLATAAASLWYLKNFFATGLPTFPLFAGWLGIFGWTREMETAFRGAFEGLSLPEFLKYLNYLFIWPGIAAAKYAVVTLSFLPLIFMIATARRQNDTEWFFELCWWLGVSLLTIMGTCLAMYYDPRYYRYSLGIFSFAAVFSIHCLLTQCLKLRKKFICNIIIILLALPGYRVLWQSGGSIPTIQDNFDVILNRVHMSDVVETYFQGYSAIPKIVEENKEKVGKAAWGLETRRNFSAFLLPDRPIVGLWVSSVIKWSSYENEELIVKDLENFGLEWLMLPTEDGVDFVSPQEYAKRAIKYDRYPKIIHYAYDLPAELTATKFTK